MGSHDAVIKGVLSGEIDAGATYSEAFELVKKKRLDAHKLFIISKTNDIPKGVIAARATMNKEVLENLKRQ